MSRSTFSVLFYANKSKVKYGIVPVMGRITINGTQGDGLQANVTAQVIVDEKRFLFLRINGTPIAQWFKEQFGINQEHKRALKL